MALRKVVLPVLVPPEIRIVRRARIAAGALARDFGIENPRIAIAAPRAARAEYLTRAYADLVATDEGRKSVYISLVAQVAELYFQLRGLDERMEITRRTYETRMEYLRIITLRFEKGNVSELDKLQAEQIAADAQSQLFSLERDIIITENSEQIKNKIMFSI